MSGFCLAKGQEEGDITGLFMHWEAVGVEANWSWRWWWWWWWEVEKKIWRRGYEERRREMPSIPRRFPLSSIFLDFVFGGILAWLMALDSRDLRHNRNPISHLSQLPITTWKPVQECDSSMTDVLSVAPVLRVVVLLLHNSRLLVRNIRGSTCVLAHTLATLFISACLEGF